MSAHVPPGSQELTPRQAEVLAIIKAAILKNGFSPSVREVMKAAGVGSPNGTMCHIEALHRKGYITYQPNTARSIRLIGDKSAVCWIACSERLPEADCRCLVYGEFTGFIVEPADYSKARMAFRIDGKHWDGEGISHWFPWPPPPQEGENKS